MSTPCDTCAFRRGSETHDHEPHNLLKGTICALAGIPFFCHHGFDYATAHISVINRRFATVNVSDVREIRVCEGWKRRIQRLKAQGYFAVDSETRKAQQQIGQHALSLMNAFIDEKDEAKKEEYRQGLQNCVQVLVVKPEQ